MDTQTIIQEALREDLGEQGDVTTKAICGPADSAKAQIVVKADGIICGLDIAKEVFRTLDPNIQWDPHCKDGDRVHGRSVAVDLSGTIYAILAGERTALNFLQRMSGISTVTALFVERTGGKAKVLDTRKTVPLLRDLDKYAVKMGGGENHRMGLHDMVMIKDNHIAQAGNLAAAVKRVREKYSNLTVEAEAKTFEQVKDALDAGVDVIMLDNMSVLKMKEAVDVIRSENKKVMIEASGGVTLANIPDIAETGVDYISVGALTHSATALDISLEIV